MSTLQKKLKPALILVGVLGGLYFIGPFILSSILMGVKWIIFHWIIDYGIYVLLFFGGSGYLWWKTRNKF